MTNCASPKPLPVASADTEPGAGRGVAQSDAQSQAAADVAAADVADQDEVDAAGAPTPLDAAPSLGQLGDVSGIVTDVYVQTEAVGGQGDDGAASTFDASIVDAAPAATPCVDKYSPMPMPGQPCQPLGETRCSDVGSKLLTILPTGKLCRRPNRVVCASTGSGKQAWTTLPCPPLQPECTYGSAYNFTCVEYPGGAACAPLELPGAQLCYPDQIGFESCLSNGTEYLYSCRKFSDPALDPLAQAMIQQEYSKQAACCPNCRFWWPTIMCPIVNACKCQEIPDQECSPFAVTAHACISNLNGAGKPGCAKNCAELGQAPQWKGKWK